MSVPVLDGLRLNHLQNTLLASATFCKLVGCEGDPVAAAEFVHRRIVDESKPRPRAIIGQVGTQQSRRTGLTQFEGKGKLDLVIEFKMFTDAELAAWYSIAEEEFTFSDHVQHLENLNKLIAAELRAVPQVGGKLGFEVFHEIDADLLDEKQQNGEFIFFLVYGFEWEGRP